MNFELSTFLKNDGFKQTRDSDKRDAFEKIYYHPFNERDCKVEISISHNSGFTSELSWSPKRRASERRADSARRRVAEEGAARERPHGATRHLGDGRGEPDRTGFRQSDERSGISTHAVVEAAGCGH